MFHYLIRHNNREKGGKLLSHFIATNPQSDNTSKSSQTESSYDMQNLGCAMIDLKLCSEKQSSAIEFLTNLVSNLIAVWIVFPPRRWRKFQDAKMPMSLWRHYHPFILHHRQRRRRDAGVSVLNLLRTTLESTIITTTTTKT